MIISELEQGSDEWLALKIGKLGGTRIKKIITPAKLQLSASREDVMLAMIDENITGISAESSFKSDSMERGNEFEPMAREEYIKITGTAIMEVGFCQSDIQPLHGCSPDGLTLDFVGGIEIKCPGGVKHQKYINPKYPDSIYKDYKLQCINYFIVNEDMQWLDTISYRPEFYPNPMHIERITRESIQEDIAKVKQSIDEYFAEYAKEYENATF